MTRLAGEVADGLLVHGFTTERYLRERTLPGARGGAGAGRPEPGPGGGHPARAGGLRARPRRSWPRRRSAVKATIAFYGSTPAYRPVLELHGWEGLADELHALSVSRREDKWTAMRDLVDDEVLATFAVVAEPDDVAGRVRERFDGLVDRFSVYASYPAPLDLWDPLVARLPLTRRPAATAACAILHMGIIVSKRRGSLRAPHPSPARPRPGAGLVAVRRPRGLLGGRRIRRRARASPRATRRPARATWSTSSSRSASGAASSRSSAATARP